MTITEKIDTLKALINWDFSVFTRETITPFDLQKSVEYALRKICQHCNAWVRSVYLPLVNMERLLSVNLSVYVKEKVEFVKPKAIGYTVDGCIMNIQTENLSFIEQYNWFDVQSIAHKAFGKDILLKLHQSTETAKLGTYDAIQALPADNQITVVNAIASAKTITNLSAIEFDEHFQSKTTTTGTTVTLENNIKITPYNWKVGDILYITDAAPEFVVITYRAMPKYGYFDIETEIPIIPSLIEIVDSFAVKYLYGILIARDSTQASRQKYLSLLETGIIKNESLALIEAKNLSGDTKIAVIKSYNPYSNTYGR